MIVAVCIDDGSGMMFNGRRQSRDRAQQQDLLAWCSGRRLWMNRDSAILFPNGAVSVDEEFLLKAGKGDVCFVEGCPLTDMEERIEGVLLYRWNRTYPADVRLELDLSKFCLTERTEFPGNSHEMITREWYRSV